MHMSPNRRRRKRQSNRKSKQCFQPSLHGFALPTVASDFRGPSPNGINTRKRTFTPYVYATAIARVEPPHKDASTVPQGSESHVARRQLAFGARVARALTTASSRRGRTHDIEGVGKKDEGILTKFEPSDGVQTSRLWLVRWSRTNDEMYMYTGRSALLQLRRLLAVRESEVCSHKHGLVRLFSLFVTMRCHSATSATYASGIDVAEEHTATPRHSPRGYERVFVYPIGLAERPRVHICFAESVRLYDTRMARGALLRVAAKLPCRSPLECGTDIDNHAMEVFQSMNTDIAKC
ncbi:hypothetical protein FISHEDRAFT_55556 [Fistulina hepatica ATCC 64428]|uniref:Uncharacterized protein n=1 Tax=Fistulina hepatica ATCC 64428 TaxID=1128425 RepID=A0A0D7AM08_9AGAR|nr:hypothetical protein FISHEDRAFT_55556 [Fistulina hepatica ATCC 64428]